MRVLQLLADARPDDAVTNQALWIDRALRELGHEAWVGADLRATELEGRTHSARALLAERWDLILDHYSIGADYHEALHASARRRWLIYHNITPAPLIAPWAPSIAARCEAGRRRLVEVLGGYELALADSSYNAREIDELRDSRAVGPKRVEVLPICVEAPAEAAGPPRPALAGMLRGRGPLLLFVGRIAPQKNHLALLKVLRRLREERHPGAELLLAGDARGFEAYECAIRDRARSLELEGAVHLLGKVTAPDLWSLYRLASVLCCMSLHEGFCVPIVEAFLAGLPVVASRAGAVAETAGDAALLSETVDPEEVDALCGAVLDDSNLAETLVRRGLERARRFSFAALRARIEALFPREAQAAGMKGSGD
jgi:glycosyltransferase involved in cell wall biosynthesis